jgi:hypothetical protein
MVDATDRSDSHDESQPPIASLLSYDSGLAVAQIRNVCVVIWRGAVTRGRFEAQRLGLERVVGAHPGDAGFLCVIEGGSPLPDHDLRRASANMISIHRRHLRYVACVMEGDGLRVAVVRTVLTGMRLLVTGRMASGFFATVPEATRHLAEYLPIGPETSFVSSVEAVRARLGSP